MDHAGELGYDFANETVFCIVGPAGLSPEVEKKLENAFTKAAESKEVKMAIEKLDLVPALMVGKELDDYLKRVWSRLEKNMKETGLIKESATNQREMRFTAHRRQHICDARPLQGTAHPNLFYILCKVHILISSGGEF